MSMTRQEQLDAVVRSYGEWPSDGEFDMAFWRKECNRVDFLRSNVWGREYRAYGQLVAYAFTRAEVEARKAELQNKPGWDDAPVNAESLIQSDGGDWQWMVRIENLAAALPRYEIIPQYSGYSGEIIGDWRETLEKRPVADDQPTPEEDEAFNSIDASSVETLSSGIIRDAVEEPVRVLSDAKKEEVRNIDSGSLTDEGGKWNGEGLPPVGVECYLQLAFNDMGECLITYMGDGVFCYRQNSSGNEYTGSVRDTVFRSIKSDRENWIDAALHVEAELQDNYKPHELIEALYDAGLAKLP